MVLTASRDSISGSGWAFRAARQSNAKLFGGAVRAAIEPDPRADVLSSSAFSFPGDRGAGRALNGGGSKAPGARRRELGAANASSFAARAAAASAPFFRQGIFHPRLRGVFALDLDLPAIFLARAYRPASAGARGNRISSRCASIVAKRSRIDASARGRKRRGIYPSSSALAAARVAERASARLQPAGVGGLANRSDRAAARETRRQRRLRRHLRRSGVGCLRRERSVRRRALRPPRALPASSIQAGSRSARDAAASSAAATTPSRRRAPIAAGVHLRRIAAAARAAWSSICLESDARRAARRRGGAASDAAGVDVARGCVGSSSNPSTAPRRTAVPASRQRVSGSVSGERSPGPRHRNRARPNRTRTRRLRRPRRGPARTRRTAAVSASTAARNEGSVAEIRSRRTSFSLAIVSSDSDASRRDASSRATRARSVDVGGRRRGRRASSPGLFSAPAASASSRSDSARARGAERAPSAASSRRVSRRRPAPPRARLRRAPRTSPRGRRGAADAARATRPAAAVPLRGGPGSSAAASSRWTAARTAASARASAAARWRRRRRRRAVTSRRHSCVRRGGPARSARRRSCSASRARRTSSGRGTRRGRTRRRTRRCGRAR